MKKIIKFFLVLTLFMPILTMASTASIPLTHKTLYGTWKKIVGSGPNDPLYVSFQRNYGIPDDRGTFFDSAKVIVMEPPKEYANYESLLDFMTPKAFSGDKNLRMENDPLTFYEIKLGAANGKAIRGSGKLIYTDDTFSPTNLLAKGYLFETEKGILEVLIQIRSAKGDIEKIEQDVDELVSSFRFGLIEDNLLIRYLKTKKTDQKPIVKDQLNEKSVPIGAIFGGVAILSFLLLSLTRLKKTNQVPIKKISTPKKKKNNAKKKSIYKK